MENSSNEISVINKNVQTGSPPIRDGSSFEEAFERCLAEIQAVTDDEFVAPNLDIHASVATVFGALPEIQALREELKRLPQLDQGLIDRLDDYARATGEADIRYAIALSPKEDIAALNAAALKLRETFRLDALAHAHRGVIDPARLAGLKGLGGYKNVAFELMEYARLFLESWPVIEGKTQVTLQEIGEAKALGIRLLEAAGHREQAPIVAAEAARIRQQAMTLLVRSYDEVRRGIAFLRWREDDADTIAPSFYAGRGGNRRKEELTSVKPVPATPILEGANQD